MQRKVESLSKEYYYTKILENTECSDWKLSKVNGCRTETMYFWPYVGKAKMISRGGRSFQFSKIRLQVSDVLAICLQIFK